MKFLGATPVIEMKMGPVTAVTCRACGLIGEFTPAQAEMAGEVIVMHRREHRTGMLTFEPGFPRIVRFER